MNSGLAMNIKLSYFRGTLYDTKEHNLMLKKNALLTCNDTEKT